LEVENAMLVEVVVLVGMLVKSDEFKFISVMFPVRTTFIFEPAKHV
jgi:hypothetical protein